MNRKIKPVILFSLLLVTACASKEDLIVVKDEVQKLKTDAESVKTQSAGSYSDVQQVRDEVSRLQGRIEEVAHTNRQSFARLGMEDSLLVHKADDLESRLKKIEEYLALDKQESSLAAAPDKKAGEAGAPKAEVAADAALLAAGNEQLAKKSYAAARESYSSLLKSYPKSELVSEAQFQLAESFFAEKWYEKAILEYQQVIAKYTKSVRRPAALYKQAVSFEKIGDAPNAKARFKSLVNLYPASPEARLARKKLQ
ncbi:MAG: tol-pal system protein YbgF [Chlorobiaceae bacterium]